MVMIYKYGKEREARDARDAKVITARFFFFFFLFNTCTLNQPTRSLRFVIISDCDKLC